MRFLTAGESHGQGLSIIIDDVPCGIPLTEDIIASDLHRRQQGYGRGGRQKIETDRARIQSGVRFSQTTGAPISLWIENKDYKNWTTVMATEGERTTDADEKRFVRPRPGHADLAGFWKYNHNDLRDSLERSSARETAARVAAGAVAKALLSEFDIGITSHLLSLGGINVPSKEIPEQPSEIQKQAEGNDLRCAGSESTQKEMREAVDKALKAGTTLGGEFEVIVWGLPAGLGSFMQWDRKLDGLLAQSVMSIQAVKAVSFGLGTEGSLREGHEFHDPIIFANQPNTLTRSSNNAGGLEGGVTNGMPLIVRGIMKPISTMRTPLASVNLETGTPEEAHFERSDVTAVHACGVIAEAMVSLVLASAMMDKFGRDTVGDMKSAHQAYLSRLHPSPKTH